MADRRAVRHCHRAEYPRATQALGLRKPCLDVVDADVEHRVAGLALRGGADAAGDLVAEGDHAVVHLVVGIDLPAEQVAEETLQLGRVLAGDFEMNQGTAHVLSFVSVFGSTPGSPPVAAIARRDMYWSQPWPCACAASSLGRPLCTSRTCVPPSRGGKVISTVLEPGGVDIPPFSQPHVHAIRCGGSTSTNSPTAVYGPMSTR